MPHCERSEQASEVRPLWGGEVHKLFAAEDLYYNDFFFNLWMIV